MSPYRLVHFRPVNGPTRWKFSPQPHFVVSDLDHREGDVIAKDDALRSSCVR